MTDSLQTEIEIKFFNVPLDEIRQKLQTTGATLKTPQRLMRRAVFGREANNGMNCTYGRVRDEGDVVTMSAKYSAVDGVITSQKEIMVVVDDFSSAVALLESFGMYLTNNQENKRETWIYDNGTLVELEIWPDLPTYIEIEGPDVEALKTVASGLGLDWDSHTTDSTDKLYGQYHSLSDDELNKKLTDLKFNEAA